MRVGNGNGNIHGELAGFFVHTSSSADDDDDDDDDFFFQYLSLSSL